jgi:hypothetical protein
MIRRRRFSHAVADIFPETGGWVDASEHVNPADAANKILTGLANLLGSETKARKLLADAMPAELFVLLPKRLRGRPVIVSTAQRHQAMLDFYDLEMATSRPLRASVRAVARKLHECGAGKTDESVERTLHRLLKARSAQSSDHRS